MKLKLMLVLVVLALGTLASAQTFGFGTSIGGSGLYCNYEVLHYYGGALWAGADELVACGVSAASTISGFSASIAAATGAQAHGKGVVYGDSIYAFLDGLPQDQWTVFTALKCNKTRFGRFVGHDGWEGVAGFSTFLGGTNQGPLSCTIPGKNGAAATKGVSTHQKN